jgi:hypothetical protein
MSNNPERKNRMSVADFFGDVSYALVGLYRFLVLQETQLIMPEVENFEGLDDKYIEAIGNYFDKLLQILTLPEIAQQLGDSEGNITRLAQLRRFLNPNTDLYLSLSREGDHQGNKPYFLALKIEKKIVSSSAGSEEYQISQEKALRGMALKMEQELKLRNLVWYPEVEEVKNLVSTTQMEVKFRLVAPLYEEDLLDNPSLIPHVIAALSEKLDTLTKQINGEMADIASDDREVQILIEVAADAAQRMDDVLQKHSAK